ncbi:ribosome-binding factor A [Acetoanaerobium pronyense]|uniref:Ribosome-binding factor A n=1 Tax=Acetoanaerobium pronyense TaxID=1482736 RepID=A0ABS4KGG3_9FIRM|nr:30S ribosome-binding factor RbfA [Acetoanaerobium pronyense]MBP2026445.1 ribosome-binding factor A [Acetoanaerobium pronyense]
MSYARTRRIGEEIKKVITELITEQKIKDTRVTGTRSLVSVTTVDVVRDLTYAYVYISVLGKEEDKDKVLEGLKSASGFIRKEVGRAVNLRHTPEIIFKGDDSIERGVNMSKLINNLNIGSEEE